MLVIIGASLGYVGVGLMAVKKPVAALVAWALSSGCLVAHSLVIGALAQTFVFAAYLLIAVVEILKRRG